MIEIGAACCANYIVFLEWRGDDGGSTNSFARSLASAAHRAADRRRCIAGKAVEQATGRTARLASAVGGFSPSPKTYFTPESINFVVVQNWLEELKAKLRQ